MESVLLTSSESANVSTRISSSNGDRSAINTSYTADVNGKLSHSIGQRFRDFIFDGNIDSSILEYLAKYHSASRNFELSPGQKLCYFHLLFAGQAKRFYYSRVEPAAETFEHAKHFMEEEFNSKSRQNIILG
jgi:hypothetical protein